jgi:alpha-L-rhamnosidase
MNSKNSGHIKSSRRDFIRDTALATAGIMIVPKHMQGRKMTEGYMRDLADRFVDPPMASRPGAFWFWLNGDVTKASITSDLEEMKAKGMGRAEIYDLAAVSNPDNAYGIGPEFMGDESVEYIRHALSEGKRLGLKMGLVASSGWNAGGSWVTPDWAAKALYSAEMKVSGPKNFSGPLPFPELPKECPRNKDGKPAFYKDVAVLALPDSADKKIKDIKDVIILNQKFDGRELKWEVPSGNWTLLRFVCSNTGQHLIVPSPKSNGLFIDFFDPVATKRHFKYLLDRLKITKENAKESGLNYFELDSMELSESTPWTDAMDTVFQSHHGYDILPYLPAFNGWILPGSYERFLYQFKQTVSDQLIFSHYTTARDFLADYGIDLVAEAGGPGPPIWNSCPVESLKALGNVSVPRGEFWIRNRHNLFLVKQIASASHIYGLGIVDAESFTTWRRWKDAPHALKKDVDRAFCEGLNEVTFHGFSNTRPEHGLPGRAYHAGSDINPTATWWNNARYFVDYLSRCSYMLRQGTFVADVAYYYGDKAPNFFPAIQKSPDSPRPQGLGFGYDFDLINTDVLLNRIKVAEGKLVLPDGLKYQLLVLPDIPDIPDHVVKKVEQLMAEGARVLVQQPLIAEKIGNKALKGISIDEALARWSIIKDLDADGTKFDFIHRKDGKTDIYFIRNRTDQTIIEDCVFRSFNVNVECWDPVTAKNYSISDVKRKGDQTGIKIQLPPYGSCFIVFSSEARALPEYIVSSGSVLTEINTPWTLSFPEKWGAPASVKLDTLISWIDHTDQGIKYFSGTATYTNRFQLSASMLKANRSIWLDLGDVLDLAEVFVNGKPAGVLWTKPFRLDIRSHVKAGENLLEVKVTNMWINRLTGDMDLPVSERYCRTNQPYVTKDRSPWGDETFRVQRSGLLGPVTLRTV